jgi:transposase InsO family protein
MGQPEQVSSLRPSNPLSLLFSAQAQNLQYIFETIEEAQDQATEWLWTYNNERPNMGIGGITPAMKLKTAA